MEESHRKILRENRSFLVQEIKDVEGINDILLEKGILTNSMNQEILAEKTEIARARKLLDTLPKRGKSAFDIFCSALIKTAQRHVAEKLNPELEHSGVTAVPAEPEPGTKKSGDVRSHTVSSHSGNMHKTSYPVPVQVNNNPKGSIPPGSNNPKSTVQPGGPKGGAFSLPSPVYPTGAASSAMAGSHPTTPNDEKYQPTFGRQESREVNPYSPSEEELMSKFPKPEPDWPYKLDMTLSSPAFKVQNCTASEVKQQLNDPGAYPMSREGIRRALIISNLTFDDEKYEERKLADMDSFRIQQVLKKMDFKIQLATNVNKMDLLKHLTKEREQDGIEMSVFVVVILSYGGRGTILCGDGELFPIQEMLDLFSAKNCPLMNGVPKLFLLQACGIIMKDFHDGSDMDAGSSGQGIAAGMGGLNIGVPRGKTVSDTKGSLHTSESETSLSDELTLHDDMLVAMATTADENHAQYSSLFILGLSNILSNYAKSDHFITLLKAVNRLKKADSSEGGLKLCEVNTALKKKLYLMPGYPHDIQGAAGDSLPPVTFGSTKPT